MPETKGEMPPPSAAATVPTAAATATAAAVSSTAVLDPDPMQQGEERAMLAAVEEAMIFCIRTLEANLEDLKVRASEGFGNANLLGECLELEDQITACGRFREQYLEEKDVERKQGLSESIMASIEKGIRPWF